MNLTLTAKIIAKAEKIEALRDELVSLLEPTREEKGCVLYDLNFSIEENGVFLFYEVWETVEDWNKHMESDHLKEFFELKDELVESIELSKWEKSSL